MTAASDNTAYVLILHSRHDGGVDSVYLTEEAAIEAANIFAAAWAAEREESLTEFWKETCNSELGTYVEGDHNIWVEPVALIRHSGDFVRHVTPPVDKFTMPDTPAINRQQNPDLLDAIHYAARGFLELVNNVDVAEDLQDFVNDHYNAATGAIMAAGHDASAWYWYIVSGRRHGDDEASTLILQAPSADDARDAFRSRMGGDPEAVDEDPADGRTVYIDSVVRCRTKPEDA